MSRNQKKQLTLQLGIVAVKEDNGVLDMGVLEDGTPFLTERGLANLAGISNGTLNELSKAYQDSQQDANPRQIKIKQMLSDRGYEDPQLYQKIYSNGREINAYPGITCMTILEYYAFEAEERYRKDVAQRNYRVLAAKSFQDFVYQMTGYTPLTQNDVDRESWVNLKSRIHMNPLPSGYFSVLEESYPLELKMINSGLIFDQRTVPDISIGKAWGTYWDQSEFAAKYGDRIKYQHTYPNVYAQSKANGKIEYWVYPIEAIAEFKKWLQTEYTTKNLPQYLDRQVKKRVLSQPKKAEILKAITPPQLKPES